MSCNIQPFCCRYVGFSLGMSPIGLCIGADGIVTNVNADPTLLSKCRMLFIAWDFSSACGDDYPWEYGDNFVRLKQWVEDGGRLVALSEYYECLDPTAFTKYNALLGFLGTSMQQLTSPGVGCDLGCYHVAINDEAVPLMAGLTNGGITYAATGLIQGTTAVPLARPEAGGDCPRSGNKMMMMEKVGKGVVIACPDNNILFGCGSDTLKNCQFFQRVFDWSVDSMFA